MPAKFPDAAVSLAGLRECLTPGEVDIDQPLAAPDFAQSDGLALAVAENMRRFVGQEDFKKALFPEIVCGQAKGAPLAEPDRQGCPPRKNLLINIEFFPPRNCVDPR